jgi:tRNA(Ile)-lysidine synthase
VRRTALTIAVDQALAAAARPRAGQTVVMGLSGGADSVALLDVLAALAARRGFRVVAAHLDHGLRPGSAADAAFCRELCARLGVALEVGAADVKGRARRDKGGTEEAARLERYAFLREVAQEHGASAIAVAHTQDDQAETFLLRLLRGAGSAGLGAMRAVNGDILRPMLEAGRKDVLAHLQARGLPHREDETNADLSFLRNRTRHELLPYLERRFNPKVRQALARAASVLSEEAGLLAEEGDSMLAALSERDGDDIVVVDRASLGSVTRAVARAAVRAALEQTGGLRGVGLDHVDRVLALAEPGKRSGKRVPLPGDREAVVDFGRLRIGPRRRPAEPFSIELMVPGTAEIPGGFSIEALADSGPAESSGATADGATAVVAAPDGPLTVRTRQPGDRVRAKGREMSLKKFLTERQVPAAERAGLPLLASGHRVLWVPGQRIDADLDGPRYVRVRLGKREC